MLTRHGWAATTMAIAAVALGRSLGLVEFYVIGAAIGATVGLAVAGSLRPMPRLHSDRRCTPPLVAVGETLRVELTVENLSARRSGRLRLWEPVGARGGAPMQVAPLDPGESASAVYRVPTDRRGVQHLGPLRAERHDPLGLCRRAVHIAGTAEVVVTPTIVRLDWPTGTGRGPLGDRVATRSLGRTGSEFHSQRSYVPGDDPRRIDWRASARTDTLVVRQTSPEVLSRCTVVLDTRGGEDEDAFERAVSVAASVVAAADIAGVAVRLVAPGIDLRGRGGPAASLRWLAEATPSDEAVDGAVLGSGSDGLGLVVAVTAGPTAPLRSAGPDDVLVVVAASAATGVDPFAIGAASIDEFVVGWQRLVGRGFT